MMILHDFLKAKRMLDGKRRPKFYRRRPVGDVRPMYYRPGYLDFGVPSAARVPRTGGLLPPSPPPSGWGRPLDMGVPPEARVGGVRPVHVYRRRPYTGPVGPTYDVAPRFGSGPPRWILGSLYANKFGRMV